MKKAYNTSQFLSRVQEDFQYLLQIFPEKTSEAKLSYEKISKTWQISKRSARHLMDMLIKHKFIRKKHIYQKHKHKIPLLKGKYILKKSNKYGINKYYLSRRGKRLQSHLLYGSSITPDHIPRYILREGKVSRLSNTQHTHYTSFLSKKPLKKTMIDFDSLKNAQTIIPPTGVNKNAKGDLHFPIEKKNKPLNQPTGVHIAKMATYFAGAKIQEKPLKIDNFINKKFENTDSINKIFENIENNKNYLLKPEEINILLDNYLGPRGQQVGKLFLSPKKEENLVIMLHRLNRFSINLLRKMADKDIQNILDTMRKKDIKKIRNLWGMFVSLQKNPDNSYPTHLARQLSAYRDMNPQTPYMQEFKESLKTFPELQDQENMEKICWKGRLKKDKIVFTIKMASQYIRWFESKNKKIQNKMAVLFWFFKKEFNTLSEAFTKKEANT